MLSTPYPVSGEGGPDRRPAALAPRDVALILVFWTFVAALSAASRLLDPRVPGMEPVLVWSLVQLAFVEYYLWALLTFPLFWLSSRYGGVERLRLRRLLLFAAVGLVVAVAVDSVLASIRTRLVPSPGERRLAERMSGDRAVGHAAGARGDVFFWRFGGPRGVTPLWFIDDFMIYLGVVAAGMARAYSLRDQTRREETAHLQAHAARLQVQLAEARLAALRTQLNPHFLFNTLHAVSALVERDPRGVRRMITRLSELLRHTLDDSAAQEISLEQELELLRRYVDIMQIRFRDRLEVRMDIAADVQPALVPNLLLQPLVENAIEHGASKAPGTGLVTVHAGRAGNDLVLRVRDNGPGPSTTSRDGVGLRNTRERLAELYGDTHRFALRPAEGGGAEAEIILPFHTSADLRATALHMYDGVAAHG